MTDTHTPRLYESSALQMVLGPALRPGGIELTRRALSFCALPIGSEVVDIGCGIGATVRFLRHHCRLKASGLDCSSVMLAQARQRFTEMPLVQGTATCLPFADRRLSALVCECVLSLVADPDRAWREFHRVLAPGGYLVVSDVYTRVPEHVHHLNSVAVTCCLKGALSRSDLTRCLDRNGFSLLSWEDHSRYLKRLAAQLAFAGLSFPARGVNSENCDFGQDTPTAVRLFRPGYFLMVARKRGER